MLYLLVHHLTNMLLKVNPLHVLHFQFFNIHSNMTAFYALVFELVSFIQFSSQCTCMKSSISPWMLHDPPTWSSYVWSPEVYRMICRNHESRCYVIFSSFVSVGYVGSLHLLSTLSPNALSLCTSIKFADQSKFDQLAVISGMCVFACVEFTGVFWNGIFVRVLFC